MKDLFTDILSFDFKPDEAPRHEAPTAESPNADIAPEFEPDIFTLDIFGGSYDGDARYFRTSSLPSS